MQLADSKNAKVDLTPDGVFTFTGSAGAGDNQYELKLELFDKVNVEVTRCSHFMDNIRIIKIECFFLLIYLFLINE